MDVTPKLRRNLRLQSTIFVVLLLAAMGLLAWMTHTYTFEADWTASGRNTLSEASQELLQRTEGPVTLTAYATKDRQLRQQIRRFADRYKRADPGEVRLRFVNPDARPDKARELGIRRDGQLVVAYEGRTQKADERSEQAVSQALQKLLRSGQRRIRFLTGHGEPSIQAGGRSSLGQLVAALKDSGAKISSLNLAQTPKIPDRTDLLVIADPQQSLLQAEVDQLRAYIDEGGSLLWLADKGEPASLAPLAHKLGIDFADGVVVDPRTRVFGLQDPTQVLVADYPDHPVTRDFKQITLFPGASRIATTNPDGWRAQPLLQTTGEAWLETGGASGTVQFEEGEDRQGPLTLGVTLTPRSEKGNGQEEAPQGQKIAVLTDSDFLANAYIGSGSNRKLALELINWLSAGEDFVTIPPQTAPDQNLNLPGWVASALPVIFLGALPLAFLLAGLAVWLRRRRL